MAAYGPSMMETLAGLRPGERRPYAPRPWPRRPPAQFGGQRAPVPTLEDDPDITLEIDAPPEPVFAPTPTLGPEFEAPTARHAAPAPAPSVTTPASIPPVPAAKAPAAEFPADAAPAKAAPAARALLLLGLALVAMLALGTLWWIEWRPAALTAGATRVAATVAARPSTAPTPSAAAASPSGTAEASAAAPEADPGATAGEQPDATAQPAETDAPPSTPAPALSPSAARRECMAQVETARLFLQIAHQSANFSYYAHATRPQIDRILATRPVGPKTVAGIADHMWERRDSPERSSDWWSSQFTRCTQARMDGNWYVVRG